MSEWKVLVGRVTLFPAPFSASASATALELYRRIWGADPDNFQGQTLQMPQNVFGATVAQGRRGVLMAHCAANPSRIDINLTRFPTPDELKSSSIVLIDDIGQLRAELSEIITRVSEGMISESAFRVAAFLQFVNVGASVPEANQALVSLIPVRLRPKITDEEDFSLQINRPHLSRSVERVKMNFLTKWSVERLQVLRFQMPQGAPFPTVTSPLSPNYQITETFVASVAFDNNNVPADTSLSGAQQASLLSEGFDAAEVMRREIGLNSEGHLE